jgi:hypothetical protein
MGDEPATQDEPSQLELERPKERASGWARLDELDPSPERPEDDRLKGLPINPASLGGR